MLRELKVVVVVRLVRSLGRFGTAATRRPTARWAAFEAGALEVLAGAAGHRLAARTADANPWVHLADLTGRDFHRHVAPHAALAAHGGRLLRLALAVYGETRRRLDDLGPGHLLDLFQPAARPFWTTRLRAAAEPLVRYPLPHW